MKALQLTGPGKVQVVTVDPPRPREGEILIRMLGATVCNQHDMKTFYNRYRFGKITDYLTPPGFPGHEGVGTIIEVAAGVDGLQVGDRVVMTGIGGPGLYAQYVTRRASAVVKLNTDREDVRDAACLELFGCVHRAISKTPIEGRCVAISGLGPAGLAAVQLARLFGAAELLGLDVVPQRLAFARRFALDRLLDASDEQQLGRLMEEGVEVVIDCSGNTVSLQNAFRMARGDVTIFGFTDQPFEVNQAVWFRHELTIRNSKILSIDEDLRPVARCYDQGRIEPGRLITHTLPLEDYPRAISLLEEKAAVKILLDPQA